MNKLLTVLIVAHTIVVVLQGIAITSLNRDVRVLEALDKASSAQIMWLEIQLNRK